MDIMIKPIVTEKANAISEKNNRYSFSEIGRAHV